MTSLNSILLSLKKSLSIRGSSIDEVIGDFDRRHSGLISTNQFQRIISSCGIFLPPKEYEYLLKSFLTPNNMVDINQFSNAVKNSHEEVKSIGDIMKSNLIDLHNRLSQRNTSLRDILRPYDRNNRGLINKFDFLRAVGSFPSSQAISEAFSKDGLIILSNLLQEYEKVSNNSHLNQSQTTNQTKERPFAVENALKQSLSRNLDLRYTFFNVDRLKSGKMSQFHFQTALSNSGLQLSPNDTTAITRYYQCDYDLIDYFHFLRDEEQYRKDHSRPVNNLSANVAEPVNLNEVLKRISTILLKRKIIPSQLFPQNSRRLTKSQFSSAIRQASLGVTLNEIDAIASSFESEEDVNGVNINSFIAAIQSLMSSATSSTVRPSVSLAGIRQRNGQSQVDVENLLKRLSSSLASRNVQLAPRFEKFDREKSGEFNVNLVNAVIKNVGIEPLTDEELEAIQKKYPGVVYPNIQWEPFTTAVDPQITARTMPVEATSIDFLTDGQINSKRESIVPVHITPLLQYVKQTAERYSMNMLDEFRMLDRLRVGFIQPTVFASFMSRNFPKLTRSHLSDLLGCYGKSEFHYIDFIRDLSQIGESNREKNATSPHPANLSNSQNFQSKGSCVNPPLSKTDEETYRSLLQRLKAFCAMRMMSPLEIFAQHDSSRFGFVLKNHLEGCFSYLQFPVSKEEVDLLVRMYHDNEHEERVYYRQIVADVEKTQIDPSKAKWLLFEKQMKKDAEESVKKIVVMIHEKLNARNRNICIYFRDAARGRLMTRDEFVSRLSALNIVIQGDDLENLVNRYTKSVGNGEEQTGSLIDWEEFVNDVEKSRFF